MSSRLQVVVVAAHSMIATTLNVDRRQVQSKWIVTSEQVATQPMCDCRINLLHRLRGQCVDYLIEKMVAP